MKKLTKSLLRGFADTYERVRNPEKPPLYTKSEIGWSIVVITDGKSNPLLQKLIAAAKAELDKSPYEIIIVGPKSLDASVADQGVPLTCIPYHEIKVPKVTGWITRKKNIGILATKYDKVVVCHDYITFKPGWKKGYELFGDFEVCTNKMVDMDSERSTDWLTWDYPGIGQALVPYDKHCNDYQYICGIYFVGKRDFLIQNLQLEQFRWNEAEDIEWSRILRKKIVFKINQESVVQFSKPKWKLSQELLEKSDRLKNLL